MILKSKKLQLFVLSSVVATPLMLVSCSYSNINTTSSYAKSDIGGLEDFNKDNDNIFDEIKNVSKMIEEGNDKEKKDLLYNQPIVQIISPGKVNDLSFNQLVWEGVSTFSRLTNLKNSTYLPGSIASNTELFLQYPSTDPRINTAYEKKGVNLYYDTLVEVRTAITGLEDQLASLRSEVEQFSEQAINPDAGGDAADSEDESAVYYNAYLANRKFNDILKITEEVVAMQNQYFAVRNLRQPRTVVPARAPENSASPKKTSSSTISVHNRFAFAQQFKLKNVASKLISKAKVWR